VKDYYVILTGSKNNAGDFLIKYRAKKLFAALRPDRDIVDLDAWKPFDAATLELVSKATVLTNRRELAVAQSVGDMARNALEGYNVALLATFFDRCAKKNVSDVLVTIWCCKFWIGSQWHWEGQLLINWISRVRKALLVMRSSDSLAVATR
jgi:hypothetical protein